MAKKKTKAKSKSKATGGAGGGSSIKITKPTSNPKGPDSAKKNDITPVEEPAEILVAEDQNTADYSPTKIAQNAIDQLSSSLKDLRANDLDSYLSDQLRNDYKDFTDYNSILAKYNAQSDAAWDLARAQQIEALNRSEAQNYANTRNAVNEMRRNLVGSASSGGNVGAANATALQALLGLGQQNAAATTEGMQNYQNASREAAAARAANAVSSLDSAREGTNSMYENATSAYGSDHTYGMQGLAEAYGNIGTAVEQNASQERQNTQTNKTQEKVAKIGSNTVQTNISYTGDAGKATKTAKAAVKKAGTGKKITTKKKKKK